MRWARPVALLLSLVAAQAQDAIAQAAGVGVRDGGFVRYDKPEARPWQYALCDMAGGFPQRMRAWCVSGGGTWNGVYGSPMCLGTPNPLTESTLVSRAIGFCSTLYSPNSCGLQSDTGWGTTIPYNILCWTGGPVYDSGVLVSDKRTLWIPPETIHALRSREIYCPAGTTSTTVNGQTRCIRKITNTCPVGNPIVPGSGKKTQTDQDAELEGIAFTRHYSSWGSGYDPETPTFNPSLDHLWRDNFDLRLLPIAANAHVVAAVSFPDGELQYFRADGSAVLPYSSQTTTSRLVRAGTDYVLMTGERAYRFDGQGVLRELVMRGGKKFTLRYADGTTSAGGQFAEEADGAPLSEPVPSGSLLEVRSFTGRTLRFGRDAEGRLTRLTVNGAASPIRYYYDSAVRLSRVIYEDGSVREYRYNEMALTSGASLPDALTGVFVGANSSSLTRFSSYGYNAAGLAISTEHAGAAGRATVSYGSGSSTVTDALGASRTLGLTTALGVIRMISQSQPAGAGCEAATSSQTYDAKGNVASRDDFNGNRVCYAHDQARNLELTRVEGLSGGASGVACSSVTAPGASLPAGGRRITTQWHPDWAVAVRVAEPKRITTYVYNGQPDPLNGNAIASCAPATAQLPDGKPILALCRTVEQATSDVDGSTGFSASPLGTPRVTQSTYGANGQVLTQTDARGFTTTFTYHGTTTADVAAGDLATVVNAAGQTTAYTRYDNAGRPLRVVAPNGVVTTTTYTPRGRVSTVTATPTTGAPQTTTYTHGVMGELLTVLTPDNVLLTHSYDAAYRLTGISDGAGNTVTYTLDSAGNQIREDFKDASGVLARSISRVYDALGRLQFVAGAAR